jgi:malate/lactate dehydrogenase
MSIVILLSFFMTPIFGEPLTEPLTSLNEEETRLYTDLEIDSLIDDISEIAIEAIEQAAAEAARAAALAAIEREAAALREAERWRREVLLSMQEIETVSKTGRKNILLAALIGTFGGLLVGAGGSLIMGGR